MLVLFEMVSLVLFSTGHLLILFCRRCGVGLRHHGMSSKNGEQGPLHTDSSRTPVILVSAKGGHAAWFVPRLNFLSKSHLFGPVLVFESVGGVDAGIREAAEELQNFILDALPHEAPTGVVLLRLVVLLRFVANVVSLSFCPNVCRTTPRQFFLFLCFIFLCSGVSVH